MYPRDKNICTFQRTNSSINQSRQNPSQRSVAGPQKPRISKSLGREQSAQVTVETRTGGSAKVSSGSRRASREPLQNPGQTPPAAPFRPVRAAYPTPPASGGERSRNKEIIRSAGWEAAKKIGAPA